MLKSKILCLIVLLNFINFASVYAQLKTKANVENVKASMINNQIEVTFSITHASKGEIFKVELKFQNGDNFIFPKTISGSTEMISGGTHKITWDVLKDVDELTGDITPVVTIKESTLKFTPRNAFVPGFTNTNKLLATLSYACLITGTIQLFSANSNYSNYKNEIDDADKRTSFFDKANGARSTSKILLGSGFGLLAVNFLLTNHYNKKSKLALISDGFGGICLAYKYSF